MTRDELKERFPNASEQFLRANASDYAPMAPRIRHPQPQPAHRPEPIRHDEAPPKIPSSLVVVITRCSTGTLDRDNLWGGVKALVDALRYSGRIPDDSEQHIELFVFQRKVRRRQQGTMIEIISTPIQCLSA